VISAAQFHVTEYRNGIGTPDEVAYVSQPMCLRDASRFAAALSAARGVFCTVTSDDDDYQETWQAGGAVNLSRHFDVRPEHCGPFCPCAGCLERRLSQVSA
jgi:hypothetical protein